MSHNLAMITARGGSKRIPRKNIKEFCGKPILAYSIEAARSTGAFDEVMVSTDDPEIAGIIISASGGGNGSVQAEICGAMEALFGLPANKIKVLKRVE